MPYTIRKENNRWCVKKKHEDGSLETMPGGCHDTREKAVKHMTAIRMHENESSDDHSSK